MDKRKQEEEKQVRKKWTGAMIKKLLPKNHRYYVLDSECIGLRIYVLITGEIIFYLQRYIPELKYSKHTKIGDFPEMSITEARKLGRLIKVDNVQGKDPILAKAATSLIIFGGASQIVFIQLLSGLASYWIFIFIF